MNLTKLCTDFYLWMQENDYDHNIPERVKKKAEIFLSLRNEPNSEIDLSMNQTNENPNPQ